jgi:hypothetical protein
LRAGFAWPETDVEEPDFEDVEEPDFEIVSTEPEFV